jgi:hypothetical protein
VVQINSWLLRPFAVLSPNTMSILKLNITISLDGIGSGKLAARIDAVSDS